MDVLVDREWLAMVGLLEVIAKPTGRPATPSFVTLVILEEPERTVRSPQLVLSALRLLAQSCTFWPGLRSSQGEKV